MLQGLARFVLARRRVVALAWLVVVIASLAVVPRVSGRLSQQFAQPGTASYRANTAILEHFHDGGNQAPLVAVVTEPAGSSVRAASVTGPLEAAFASLRAEQVRTVSWLNGGSRFTGEGGRVGYALLFTPATPSGDLPAGLTTSVSARLDRALTPGARLYLTGTPILSTGKGGSSGSPQVLAETVIAGAGALVVLAVVFGSAIALVPLLVAAVSVLTSFLLLYALSFLTQVNFIAEFLIGIIGLGVAIDYSLLVVTRWREEREAGKADVEAVRIAITVAGRAIAFSGTTVAISLAVLVFLPVPFLRSLGFSGLFIPLVSVLVSVTLLPVVLLKAGPRLDRHRMRLGRRAAAGSERRGGWQHWAEAVVRRRWLATLAALVVLVPLALATLGLRLGDAQSASLERSGPAVTGLQTLVRAGAPAGVVSPIEVLVAPGHDPGAVAARLGRVPGVAVAVSPSGGALGSGGWHLVEVIAVQDTTGSSGTATVDAVRAALGPSPATSVGGPGPSATDFTSAVYGRFPLVIALVGVLTFLLLALALRSLVLPLKALALNALSVAAAYGVMVLVWQDGHGSSLIWGVPATGAVTSWIPLMVFAFLFGLSMDYEVFLLARIRERYDETGSTNDGVVEGLARTGRLITGAALILFFAFVSLAGNPLTFLKVFATGLAAGILIDAFVVRSLLAPALVSLFGRANWWLPGPLRRMATRRDAARAARAAGA